MTDTLRANETLDVLTSADGRFTLVYQGDGNLVLYAPGGHALWASQTDGRARGFAVMQEDGNFVIYTPQSEPIWSSGTPDHPGALLVVQSDGNVVIYQDGVPIWNTGTQAIDTPSMPPPFPGPLDPGGNGSVVPASSAGFVESADSTSVRGRFSTAALHAFLPSGRGPFTFPAPYGTQGIRITIPEDGGILPVGYSYWPNCNMHARNNYIVLFLGHQDGHPRFFWINKSTYDVSELGPMLTYEGTGEGWYWSGSNPELLYVLRGPQLLRVNVPDHREEVVCDISATYPGCRLWQAHSSTDDRVHSMTVQRITNDGPYEDLGALICFGSQLAFIPKQGLYDECQVDASGKWLLIKETFTRGATAHLDNRIINLSTMEERRLLDEKGALGHSDMGMGFMTGEVDQYVPGELSTIDLVTLTSRMDYHLTQWDSGGGHYSVRGNRCLISGGLGVDFPRVNELGIVTLDGSQTIRLVAPNLMTGLPARAGDVPYDLQVKANLDPVGEWACWTANPFGRLDAFLVRV